MKIGALLLAGLLIASSLPCQGASSAPLFVSPDFNAAMDGIDVYVVDFSQGYDNDKECDAGVGRGAGSIAGAPQALWRRGYNRAGGFGRSNTTFYETQITPSNDMLSNPSKQWLDALGDQRRVYGTAWTVKSKRDSALEQVPTRRWTLIFAIDDLGSKHLSKSQKVIVTGLGSHDLGNASLSMYLYDRNGAALLWHDHAERYMTGNPLDNMSTGNIKQGTCANLANSMILKLPQHKTH